MSLYKACIAETLGTFLLVLFGTGAVASAVLTGALTGLWQVAVVWGFGVTLAIYATAAASGAHLNPAVTLAFAIFRHQQFPLSRLAPYWASQLLGAALAGLVILIAFGPFLDRFDADHALIRGQPGSEHSAMVFGEYFPNPDIFGTGADAHSLISPLGAAAVEALGTAILVFMIFALSDHRNSALPIKAIAPFFIGFTIAVLIAIFAPLTQMGINPARDFGPRIVAFFAGWDSIAIPGPRNGFWVYIVGPLVGSPLGAALYHYILRTGYKLDIPPGAEVSTSDSDTPLPKESP
jgi:glycerol uptake facilitator protein